MFDRKKYTRTVSDTHTHKIGQRPLDSRVLRFSIDKPAVTLSLHMYSKVMGCVRGPRSIHGLVVTSLSYILEGRS